MPYSDGDPVADDLRLRSIEYAVDLADATWLDGTATTTIVGAIRSGM